MKPPDNQEEILRALLAGGRKCDSMLDSIYNHWKPPIVRQVMSRGGDLHEAQDVFQLGICEFLTNIRLGKFQGRSSLRTYLTRICSFIWYSEYRKKQRRRDTADQFEQEETLDDPLLFLWDDELGQVLDTALGELSENCQSVLRLWAQGFSYKEILPSISAETEGTARKQKHDCQQKLIAVLKQRPGLWDRLKDFL